MGKEIEIKLRAPDAAALQRILEDPEVLACAQGSVQSIRMRTVYYDTPSGALGARRWTLRVRQENEASVVTIKTPGEGYARGEWACAGKQPEAALAPLIAQGAPPLLAELAEEGLRELCGARFCRRVLLLALPGQTQAELCLDEGVLLGGGRELPFYEAELELKAGSETALLRFARALSEKFSLPEEEKSKFVRARQLANGK